MTKTLLSLSILATLTACASAPMYECGLEESPQAKCASMEQAYAAAKRADPKSKATSVFDAKAKKDIREDNRPFFKGADSEMPEPGQQGMPVFAQPKVHRVWVAPYVDADDNLRTGEYTYFNTAGKWNYGSTKNPGAAAGVFGPAKPGNLGFTPIDKKPTVQAPSKPSGAPGLPANKLSTTAATDNSVTQPYQKLSD